MLALVLGTVLAQEPPRHFQVEFERDLYQDRDLSLQGVSAVQTVEFPLPRRWNLTEDPVLNLSFGHSNTLLEDRSTLTLRLNDQGLGSVALGPLNATDGRMELRIPRHLLRDHNRLTMLVDQHYTRDCEDPFDPSLWTRISRLSTIDFSYESVPIIGDLRDFPYPLFDRQGYGPLRLTLVHPGPVSASTAEAAGLLTYALGRLVDYRGVELRPSVPTLELAGGPALLIGTPEELPELAAYVADLPTEGDVGLLAITTNPADSSLPVLVVTGRTPAAVRNAAQALAANDRFQVLTGQRAIVTSMATGEPPTSRQRPIPAPAEHSFKLSELGFEDASVRGFYAPPITVPLMLEGDARLRPRGGQVRVNYSYAAQLQNGFSSLEVLLNNVSLRSVPLDRPEGEERASILIDLPAEVMSPYSELRFLFHLYHRDFGACVRVSDRHIWGTLWSDSEVILPRDRYAFLPDLSLLRFQLWPFGEQGTEILLPDEPTAAEVAAGLQLMADLGRRSVGSEWSARLTTSAASKNAKNRILLLPWDSPHAVYQQMEQQGQITSSGAMASRLSSGGTTLIAAQVESGYRTVEATLDTSDGSTLVVRAPDALELLLTTQQLGDPEELTKLAGNLAILGSEGEVRTVNVVPQRLVGQLPPPASGRVWLQQRWIFLAPLALLAVVAAVLLGRVARRRGGQV